MSQRSSTSCGPREGEPTGLVALPHVATRMQAGHVVWTDLLTDDPLPWLLDPEHPAVRAATLQRLLDRPFDDPEVTDAAADAMRTDPIAAILAAQSPDGWWVKPGPGYGPKYTGTVWSLIFLDQLGADPADDRVQAGCDYVLRWVQSTAGGFGCSGVAKERRPPPSSVIHCLNGNLLRALVGFGHLHDDRVQAALDWAARSITGADGHQYYASGTCGPGFACAANDKQPCAWGAVKEMLALSRVPEQHRTPLQAKAVAAGAAFLLAHDPAVADYPMGWGNTKPSSSWFRLGFPSGYVADVLQVLEVFAGLGLADDQRLAGALDWVISKQGKDGRWANRYAYNGKTVVDFEKQGAPSRWVTLRACSVLRAAHP